MEFINKVFDLVDSIYIILILLFILWFLFKLIKLNIIFASNLERKIYFINLTCNKDNENDRKFVNLKKYVENIGVKFNVYPDIIKGSKLKFEEKSAYLVTCLGDSKILPISKGKGIFVVNFNPDLEVEKYKEIFDYAQRNNIFVFIYGNPSSIDREYGETIGKYSIIDVVNTPIRLISIMFSVMKIKS